MIACRQLTKRFGALVAVDRLDLDVPAGTITALLGPNGAGKSTTVEMLAGLSAPSAGEITVAGVDVTQSPVEVKRRIGVVPQQLGLFSELTIEEHMALTGDVYGLSREQTDERTQELLDFLALDHGRNTYLDQCSHGMRKKTALAMALIHDPQVLFLDEPFEGLDISASRGLQDVLLALAERGRAILITTHVFSLVEAVANQAVFLRKGRAVWRTEEPSNLEQAYFERVEDRRRGTLSWFGS